MGADHDVDIALGNAFFDLGQRLRRDQARGLCDIDGKTTKSLGKGFAVLARQQRRRHHHRDLFAVERHRKCRAQRHLGLAKANVAADQPVHRTAALEVL